MCTSIAYSTDDFYFGRNLDVDQNYRQSITIVPRNYPLSFSCEECQTSHFAMIGMATIINNYPLYADACNEKGLCVSGLNFTDNAVYFDKKRQVLMLAHMSLYYGYYRTMILSIVSLRS